MAVRHQRSDPVRIDCDGGCGKFQMVRTRRVDGHWDYLGCGTCDGWREIERRLRPVPEGMVVEHTFHAAGGFSGLRLRIASQEERASIVRARAIRDAALRQL